MMYPVRCGYLRLLILELQLTMTRTKMQTQSEAPESNMLNNEQDLQTCNTRGRELIQVKTESSFPVPLDNILDYHR